MSVKLIFTKPMNRVSLEQFHQKPMGLYGGANFRTDLTDVDYIAFMFNGDGDHHHTLS